MSISLGTTCALDTEGKAYCWGTNANGQIGDNTAIGKNTPVNISAFGDITNKTLKAIYTIGDDTSQGRRTCALDTEGKAYCWGIGQGGQIGDGSNLDRLVPTAVSTSGALNGKTIIPFVPYSIRYF